MLVDGEESVDDNETGESVDDDEIEEEDTLSMTVYEDDDCGCTQGEMIDEGMRT
jgi:hypothetical protein